ncbi:MAG: hypothetical protein NVS2B2_10580 [Ktedonobacteraceae bacterium]
MKMKVFAVFAFLANAVLFATYYTVAKEVLGRIDPILFTFFEMTMLTPVALGILAFTSHQLTWPLVKRGVLLGSCLCLALFTIAIALKYSTATGTAFFPALNGFLAAVIAWLVFRQPANKTTWYAGILSVVGTSLLLMNSEMGGIRGAVIAFLGGLFFTIYVFLSDYKQNEPKKQEEQAHWPLFGIELLTMALWACLVALLFGNWQDFHPSFPKDALVILYVAGACTFLPTLITVLMQKHISAVTISFIYILEPILGAVIANFYLREVLPLYGYLGGGLVVVGAFLHTLGSVKRAKPPVYTYSQAAATLFHSYLFPVAYCCSSFLILYGVGGFPPLAWRELYSLAPTLLDWLRPEHRAVASAVLNSLPRGTQGDSILLLFVQALCWLIGWGTLAVIVCMTLLHTFAQRKATHVHQDERDTKSEILKNSFYDNSDSWLEETRTPQEFIHSISMSFAPITDTLRPTTGTLCNSALWGGYLDTPVQENTVKYYESDREAEDYYDTLNITPQDFRPITSTDPIFMTMNRSREQYLNHVELVEYVE